MNLVSLLTWSDAGAVRAQCATLDRRYLEFIAGAINGAASPAVKASLDALPDSAYLRVLRAPATCEVASRAHAGHTAGVDDFIAGAVRVEQRLLGRPVAFDRDAWSALGDAYCPPGSAAALPIRAERIAGDIVVDFDSPDAAAPLRKNSFRPVPYGDAEPFTPAERDAVRTKLRAAAVGIAASSVAALSFVTRQISVVIPRKQTDPNRYPTSFKGSSTPGRIGRSMLYNAHFARVDAGHVAQSIIHEAIHNALYKLELFEPSFVDWEAADAVRIVSPWTGNRVNLVAITHASLVFFGLYHFFSLPNVRAHLPARTADHYVARAHKGFAGGALQRCLVPHRRICSPAFLDQLDRAQAHMLAAAAA